MIEAIREKYIFNKCQVIILDDDGFVAVSDDHLFEVQNGILVEEIHPFFETIRHLLADKNAEHVFHCIHLEINEVVGNYNIVFNSGSTNTNPFIVLYDFTENCNYLQTIVQRRNESVIALEAQQTKEIQLNAEKDFKNKFLASISHDLRTPLGAILGFLEMLENTSLTVEQKEIVHTIEKSGKHIKALIDDLLDLSKIEAGALRINYAPFSVSELAKHIQSIYAPKMASKHLAFSLSVANNCIPYLMGDKTRILQIIINFLDNAYKFTTKGNVTLALNTVTESTGSVMLKMVITDTGMGFPENKQQAINSFTKFHNAEIEGSGLGLSIVKRLLEMMDGAMHIASKQNIGTTISVSIPMQIAAGTQTAAVAEKTTILTNTKNTAILIADDNEINILLLKKMLQGQDNYLVDSVTNGQEVLSAIMQKQYNIILMDIQMPIMDGLTATAVIRNHSDNSINTIPIIALTANAGEEYKQRYLAAGMQDAITKPYTKEALFNTIEKVLSL